MGLPRVHVPLLCGANVVLDVRREGSVGSRGAHTATPARARACYCVLTLGPDSEAR